MLSKPVIGRPPKDKVEDQFKECIKKHLPRNMLECKVFEHIYTKFMVKKPNRPQLTREDIAAEFTRHNQRPLFEKFEEIRQKVQTTVSGKEIGNYTSTKDILYLLHYSRQCFRSVNTETVQVESTEQSEKPKQSEKRAITTRQLHLLLVYYLQYYRSLFSKNGLITEPVHSWMDEGYGRFVNLMRNGPEKNVPVADTDYVLSELLARWALELATHDNLAIAFGQPRA